MAVVIKELQIEIQVSNIGQAVADARIPSESKKQEKEELLTECLEKLMEVLDERNER